MSTSPSRSLFGSLKNKLSGKSRSRSPSPNPSFERGSGNISGHSSYQAPPPAPFKPESNPNDLPPPPPYSAIAGPSSVPPAPSITLTSPEPARQPSPAPSFSSARSNPSITSAEDKYAFLSSFDTIFLIDDSGSMHGERWKETKAALLAITPICTDHDANGIDIYFLNTRSKPSKSDPGGWCNIRTKAQVEALFNQVTPRGVTPLGTRINQILMPYLRTYEAAVKRTGTPEDCGVKPINMIVITDGVPTDDPESIIIDAARKLDKLEAPPHQVGIQLFQVGGDKDAANFLMELDDGLAEAGGVRDMVDTVTFDKRTGRDKTLSADAILKVVLGAVVKRLDRRRMSGESRRAGHLAP